MKLRISWILLPTLLIALISAPGLAFDGAADKLIHLAHNQKSEPSWEGEHCWEPECVFQTTIDSGEVSRCPSPIGAPAAVAVNRSSLTPDFFSQVESASSNWLRHGRLIDNTGTSYRFVAVQGILVALLVCVISSVIMLFPQYLLDVRTERARAAVYGYMLSVDLGFVLLASRGFWAHDRIWGAIVYDGTWLTWSPEIVIFSLVACAWVKFLQHSSKVPILTRRQA